MENHEQKQADAEFAAHLEKLAKAADELAAAARAARDEGEAGNRDRYRAYQREYMRKRREAERKAQDGGRAA